MPFPALPPEILKIALDKWDSPAAPISGWHGYGTRVDGTHPALHFFLEPHADSAPLEAIIRELPLSANAEIVRMRRFAEIPGPPAPPIDRGLVLPGSEVYATSNNRCNTAPSGTVGALLKNADDANDKRRWLLSNHHILAHSPSCRDNLTIFDAAGTISGDLMKCIELDSSHENEVDAAVVLLPQPNLGSAVYPQKLGLIYGTPGQPSPGLVKKLGNATEITSGTIAYLAERVIVSLPSSGINAAVFENQMLIADVAGEDPFAADGDSGSLVVQAGHPIGLLFGSACRSQNSASYTAVARMERVLTLLSGVLGVRLIVEIV
jgi:hypothetical protein